MIFYYDRLDHSEEGCVFNIDLEYTTDMPQWVTYSSGLIPNNCKEVVFDSTFYNCAPISCFKWFFEFKNLAIIKDLKYFNSVGTQNMQYMFFGCESINSIDLTNFITTNIKYIDSMFMNCKSLKNLDLESFSTPKCSSFAFMFSGCRSLSNIQIGCGWSLPLNECSPPSQESSYVFQADGYWYDCNTDEKYTSSSIPVPLSQTIEYTAIPKKGWAVFDDTDLSNPTLTFYYDRINHGYWSFHVETYSPTAYPGWLDQSIGIPRKCITVSFDKSFFNFRPTTCYKWFCSFENLETINNIEYLNTSNVQNMERMFSYCRKLTNIDVTAFDTSKVNNFSFMFEGCSKINFLDLGSFLTSKATTMNGMFKNCFSLSALDLGNFDTSSVKDMAQMFYQCVSIENLDLSSFNTGKVNTMSEMLWDCNHLKSVDLSSFDTTNCSAFDDFFRQCIVLERVTIGLKWSENLANCSLPVPDSYYISGADGHWYNNETKAKYTRDTIPVSPDKVTTYVAIPPSA